MQIEVREIGNHFPGTNGRHFAHPEKSPKRLSDLDVQQVRRVQFVILVKEAGLDASKTETGI